MIYDHTKEFSALISKTTDMLPKGSKVLFIGDAHGSNLALVFAQGLHVEVISSDINEILSLQEMARQKEIFIIARHTKIASWVATRHYDAIVLGENTDMSFDELCKMCHELLSQSGFLISLKPSMSEDELFSTCSSLKSSGFSTKDIQRCCANYSYEESVQGHFISFVAQK